jgi:hypothetical protein
VAQATIVVTREAHGYPDRLRAYQVLLDGGEVGPIRCGEWLTIETGPGEHNVYLAIDWRRSPTITLNLVDGEEVWLRARPLPWPHVLALPYFLTVGRSRYIALELAIPPADVEIAGAVA